MKKEHKVRCSGFLGQKGSKEAKGKAKKEEEKGTLFSFQTQPFFIAAP